MSNLREEFEKLPWISQKVKHAYWSEKYCQYVAINTMCKEKDLHFLDGAWLAFQEQQKKMDAVIKWVEDNKKSIPLSEWHGYTTEEYVDADDLLELLK